MAQDYIGACVSIFGINSPDHGCTCEHHAVCGSVVHLDMLVRFKKTVVLSGKLYFGANFFTNPSLTILCPRFSQRI